MQIDRTRFLVLTAALAAATSCKRIQAELSSHEGKAVGDKSVGLAATPADEGHDAGGITRATALAAAESLGDDAPGDAGAQSARPVRPRGDGGVNDCEDLAPGAPQCEGFGIVRAWCADSRKVLTSQAQGQVLACLAKHTGKMSICSSFLNRDCDVQVFLATPPDPATAAECEAIEAKCATRHAIQFRGGILDSRVTAATCQRVFAAAKPSMHAK